MTTKAELIKALVRAEQTVRNVASGGFHVSDECRTILSNEVANMQAVLTEATQPECTCDPDLRGYSPKCALHNVAERAEEDANA